MSTDAMGNPNAGRVRASDAEREEFARMVREATGEGRLNLGEGDERLAQIYAAKYRDELRPLVSDLPAGATVEPARVGSGPGPGRGGWPARDQNYMRPHPAAFVFHVGVVLLVSLLLVGLWALTGPGFFWPAIPLIFFWMGIVRHARWAGGRRYYRWYR
jgi:hypothetical protein